MRKKYILYMIFAAICMGVNLGSQFILSLFLPRISVLQATLFHQELSFLLQLITGTILGFIAKFILDKFIVFKEVQTNLSHTLKQMIIYGVLAVLTTIIFWTFEFSFKLAFTFKNSELIGGFIGLAIGYTIKFFLDKKFVFVKKE
ncbi:MAG: GtrA family protein [Spirochaetales bacterium]|nr:GtrA family protein [Spirochaetales bacterium]